MQRQSISVAPLGGLSRDLRLVGTQFSTAISVHYAGYIIGQIPSNLILTRTRPSWTMATAVLLGGAITLCMVVVKDFTGLVLQRLFLGIIAAPVWPGTLYVASSFYKRKELGTRVSILYSSNILSTAFQGLIAAPIFSELGGSRGLGGWQWMYIILGTAAGSIAGMLRPHSVPLDQTCLLLHVFDVASMSLKQAHRAHTDTSSYRLLYASRFAEFHLVAFTGREEARPRAHDCRHG